MMKMAKWLISIGVLGCASFALGAAPGYGEPSNPAAGIWIQQVGDIVPHAATTETLYYTKYSQNDRVKSVDYYYDGNGYLQLKNKRTLCTESDGMQGADGIVHHPDGSLIVAAQKEIVHKISKNGGSCVQATATTSEGVWHLMVDPNHKYVWAAGIPGKLHRIRITNDVNSNHMDTRGYNVTLVPASTDRERHNSLATLIWDKEGNAFFTRSDYYGGGCEKTYRDSTQSGDYYYENNKKVWYNFKNCNSSEKKTEAAKAYFGYITDTTKVYAKDQRAADTLRVAVGDTAITKLGVKILIDSLEGAHGGTYDPYSNTIFVFGGARIVQIKPEKKNGKMTATKVGTIDLHDYFFDDSYANLTKPRTNDRVGWRLDQGTVDGHGHLFVASNTGHMVFVDYTSNAQRYITDNVLVHIQWIDNWLDDLAPLDVTEVIRSSANQGGDELSSSSMGRSSSRQEYSSSSKPKSSSSSKKVSSSSKGQSSSSGGNGGNTSSSKMSSSSSGGNGGSGGSSSSKKVSSSSGDNNGSSGGNGGSSSSNKNGSSSSKGGNGGSSGRDGDGDDFPDDPSSDSNNGNGDDFPDESSSSRVYVGFDDYEDEKGALDFYPSNDNYEDGDSLVGKVGVMIPVDSAEGTPGTVKVGENVYMKENNPVSPMDLRYGSGLDSAQVGQVVAIVLDSSQVKKIFGDSIQSLTVVPRGNVDIVNPNDATRPDSIVYNADGSVVIWVTADTIVEKGSIYVVGNGKVAIIDNINFFDPIPDARIGFVKDSDGDKVLDFQEILLKDTLPASITVKSIEDVINGKTRKVNGVIEVNKSRDRLTMDVSDITFPEDFPDDAYAIITYETENGTCYTRKVQLIEVGNNVINSAFAIRDKSGKDSLFIKFNIDLIPADIANPDMLIMIKQELERRGFDLDDISNAYMPSRNMVVLVGKKLGLVGDDKDSISLYPNVTFQNLQYITSDEYEREVPVKVIDRVPSVKNVEYWDTDGDGVLDQIVTNFTKNVTSEDLEMLHMSFPWYSFRGLLIQLMASPDELSLDPKDSTRIVWNVRSSTQLTTGVTSISDDLPPAIIYTYYDVLGETFVNEENAVIVDKMPPVIVGAVLNYGKKVDSLAVTFSEVVQYQDLKGRDYFRYIHGKDVIDLLPSSILWSSDGRVATLVLDGSVATILPGDSLMVVRGEKDDIMDNYGNIAGEKPSPVVIAGLLNHLVESTKMGHFDDADDMYRTLSSVNLRYVPSTTTKEDLEKEGALGQLVQLGERFVPQLVDRAQISADGTVDPSVLDSLKPENIFITFVVNYYDHLGQYVNDTSITVQCNSWKFGGNCLNTDQKVFVNWNFKDHSGRFVGTGVYMVQFKMVVRYEKKKIEEEVKDKWGVRRSKKRKK